jgi:hypothetical protein
MEVSVDQKFLTLDPPNPLKKGDFRVKVPLFKRVRGIECNDFLGRSLLVIY